MTTYSTQREAVRAAYAIQDRGGAGTIYSHDGTWAALDLDAGLVAVSDRLYYLGLDSTRALAEAQRLIRRGF